MSPLGAAQTIFVRNLKLICIDKSVFYADISRATGISTRTFTKLTKHKGNPTMDTLEKIANFFEVPLHAFFNEKIFADYISDETLTLMNDLPTEL